MSLQLRQIYTFLKIDLLVSCFWADGAENDSDPDQSW